MRFTSNEREPVIFDVIYINWARFAVCMQGPKPLYSRMCTLHLKLGFLPAFFAKCRQLCITLLVHREKEENCGFITTSLQTLFIFFISLRDKYGSFCANPASSLYMPARPYTERCLQSRVRLWNEKKSILFFKGRERYCSSLPPSLHHFCTHSV